ncbi:MAG: SHOCT domain-containing protein [Flavobacteriales bacterium]|nr:SHOCT domain-containing protein [Flavobacteriales bacterium]
MKKITQFVFIATLCVYLFSSCATIVGGSKYTAYVQVTNDPKANIRFNGLNIGQGSATIDIFRKDAARTSFEISKEGCPTQTFKFEKRIFRGWSLVGSFLLAPVISGVPIPIWNVVDFATGAYYKPDKGDPRIIKNNYKNYYYNLSYDCDSPEDYSDSSKEVQNTKEGKLIELKELFDKGMITKEEYEKARQAILAI